jgi:hypothetical protein
MWGPLFMAGQGLAAFALGISVLVMLSKTEPMNRVLTEHHFHDLGKFLFAFLMLWTYLMFSQYLIVYSANLQEEVPHYIDRNNGGYEYVTYALMGLHFAVPYALLLSRDVKRGIGSLRLIAVWLLVMRVVDYYAQCVAHRRGAAHCDWRRVPDAVCHAAEEPAAAPAARCGP